MIRNILKNIALSIPPIKRLESHRDLCLSEIQRLTKLLETAQMSTQPLGPSADLREQLDQISSLLAYFTEKYGKYEVLEGTPYSRYLVPIEYTPSRDFRPRWGHSKPRIPSLNAWFNDHASDYQNFMSAMRPNAQKLSSIPLHFSEANLPEPAWVGVPYCAFDAVALYTIITQYKPKRYFEIGSGITTCFAKKAIKDAGLNTVITSVDPQPRAKVDTICDFIIRDGLETCDMTVFDSLEAGDILFFDGSHRSFMNSDVTVFFIDVLPRIKPGVIIHIHDITLPWDYDASFSQWYWNESYLLAVYLMGNMHKIKPIAPTTFMCRDEQFKNHFDVPMLDLGEFNDSWRGGGAMWFTHTA